MRLPPSQWPKVGLRAAKYRQKNFEQTLHFVSLFLLPFLTNKQISAVVSAAFQGRYPRAVTMQVIRQLQWTNTKATSENLIISVSGKQQGAVMTDQKIFPLLIYDFCMMIRIFKVVTSLSIFSTTRPSSVQQKSNYKSNT